MKAPSYTTEIAIPQPPEVIWRRLTDFEGYGAWNPHYEIEGPLKAGAKIQVTLKRPGRPPHTAPARIVTLQPLRSFAYSVGNLLFRERRWFELEPTPTGVLVRHGIVFSGLLASLRFSETHKLSRLEPFYRTWEHALATGRLPQTMSGGAGNRHQRRAKAKR